MRAFVTTVIRPMPAPRPARETCGFARAPRDLGGRAAGRVSGVPGRRWFMACLMESFVLLNLDITILISPADSHRIPLVCYSPAPFLLLSRDVFRERRKERCIRVAFMKNVGRSLALYSQPGSA